jgi:hypothetical protein
METKMALLTSRNFTPQDLLSKANRDVAERVAEAWDDIFGKDTRGGAANLSRRSVILEGLGTCFRHNDWSDDDGYFMTIRLHPLDMHREETRENARKLTRRFLAGFQVPRNRIEYEGHEDFLKGGSVTVFVVTHNHPIGD